MAQFEVIDGGENRQSKDELAARQLLKFALGQLSRRTLVAAAASFTLLGVASVWFLWYTVLPDPTVPKLIGVGMYSVFLLVLELIRKRNSE